MSFVIDTLRSIREQTVAELYAAQTRLADLDASLAVLVRADEELEKSAADALIYEPHGLDVKAVRRIVEELKRTEPKPAKPFIFGPDVKEGDKVTAVPVDGPPVTGTVTKVEGDTLSVEQEQFEPTPWTPPVESQDEVALAPAPVDEPKPAKKGGRRTNEELAADAGVSLDDVKAWLGAGQRVSKAAIEEFASIHPDAAVANQTLDESSEPDAVVEQAHEETDPAQPAAAEPAPWDDDPFKETVPAQPTPPPAPVAEAPAAPSGYEAMETEPFENPF